MQQYLKKIINSNFKSSPKFGRLSVDTKNFKEILRERRFLYFTKKGPIEIVLNIKHYLSALVLSIIFIFKVLQFLFFGISSFFNYMTFKNDEINRQKFTETEIEALKNIAQNALKPQTIEEISEVEINKNIENLKEPTSIAKIDLKEKLNNIKNLFSNFGKSFNYEIERSDEVVFDQFSGLASPEMLAMDYTVNKETNLEKNFKSSLNKKFAYKDLPVNPYIAPRTKKLKIINFNRKLDSEILQLVNVFKSLNLKPDNIDINEITSFLDSGTRSYNIANEELIDYTSLRFKYLEEMKNAIIYLPLKPPMQYYYVSSQYGYRIHPKTKVRQMHHGIDMAGTWQEEVRAPADGIVVSAGRNGSFGKAIKIVHKHGVSTVYGHLHKLTVRKGDFVTEGNIIGKMGSTGRAVGAHLHYEIKVNNKSVNPYDFISLGRELLSSSIIRK